MKKYFIFTVFCMGIIFSSDAQAKTQGRGMLVAQLSDPSILASRRSISKIITTAKKFKIDTLYIQVYRGNRAWFNSKTADANPYQGCLKQPALTRWNF